MSRACFQAYLALILLLSPTISYAGLNSMSQLTVNKKLANDFSLIGDVDYRTDHGLFRRQYDAGLIKKLSDSWSIGGKYHFIYLKNQRSGVWDLSEKRPQFLLTKKFRNDDAELEVRYVYEYQRLTGRNHQRQRMRFRLTSKKEFLHLRPMISDELNYDLTISRYNRNRFEAGVILPKFSYFTPSLLFRSDANYESKPHHFTSIQFLVFVLNAEF